MLSILIPTYNYNILPLVKELHAQCMNAGISFEIVILDDCSSHEYNNINSKVTLLQHCFYNTNSNNIGRTATRKRLADKALYNSLLFLDADVMPVSTEFINMYLQHINLPVVFGGYAYRSDYNGTSLRLKYGVEREQKPAVERSKNPYGSIFSGNLLIAKDVFSTANYAGEEKHYGMDVYFGFLLLKNKIEVMHIDNPIYHLGLEDDETFFRKALEAVAVRKHLLEGEPEAEDINSLLNYYKILKRYRLASIASVTFKLFASFIKKQIMKKEPNLFWLDVYRLGYICSIKK